MDKRVISDSHASEQGGEEAGSLGKEADVCGTSNETRKGTFYLKI